MHQADQLEGKLFTGMAGFLFCSNQVINRELLVIYTNRVILGDTALGQHRQELSVVSL